MKRFLTIALLSAGLAGRAAVTEDSIQAGLKAEAAGDAKTALQCFLSADRAKPNDPAIQQRVARQYSDLCDEQPTPAKQREFAERALAYTELAVKAEPNNAEHVLSLAICHGKLARVGNNPRTKVQYSRLIKEEAERAIALDPNYAWAHYVLGRWHYEVAKLARPTQFLVNVLFGGLGDASNAAAVRELKRATELEAKEPAMWIDLGFAYAAAGQNEAARTAWKKGLELPGTAHFEDEAKARAKTALANN